MPDKSKERQRAEAEFAAVMRQAKPAPAPVKPEDQTAKLKALRLAKEAADKSRDP